MSDEIIKRIEELENIVKKQEEEIQNLTAISSQLTAAVANHSEALKIFDANISQLCDTIIERISEVSNNKKEE